LSWAYRAIRKNQGDHEVEICVADDASNDGTWEWCQERLDDDPNFRAIKNEGPERLGHTILYDRLVNEVASHDLCMIYHADMYLCPGALDAIEKHMYSVDTFSREELRQDRLEEYERETGEKIDKLNVKVKNPNTIVSLTRIEPPLHPPGPEKILQDFGIEPEEFDEEGLLEHVKLYQPNLATTEGIFAPWAFWKKDFQEIEGHDPIFAPQSKEDTDIFNRFHLNGIKFIQTWERFVYHMTCRGSRFAEGAERNPNGEVFMKNRETDEWLKQNIKSTREFIRKWGHYCKHDKYMKPIIPPKYDIGFVLKNSNTGALDAFEPWCSSVYADGDTTEYYKREQPNTHINLGHKLRHINDKKHNDIIVEIDCKKLTQEDITNIQRLPEIIEHSGETIGSFSLGNLNIDISATNHFEDDLIFITNNKNEEAKAN